MDKDKLVELADQEFELVVCGQEGRIVCIYLNDYRVAGGKPWGGGSTLRSWKIRGKDLFDAIPALRSHAQPK